MSMQISLADLTEAISLVCNKGIVIMNNERETVFTVIQENCPVESGTCEDCFDFCSNYTDVIVKIKDVDVNGPFNMSWTINGDDSIYLMQYGLQQYNGILLIYYTVLRLPTAKIPSKGIYSLVVQCQTNAFARIRVTIWLPAGNRTSYYNYPPSSVGNTMTVPGKTNDGIVHAIQDTTDSPQTNKELSAGTMVAVIFVAVFVFTVIVAVPVVYLRRAITNRQPASDRSLQQISNNQYCKTNKEMTSESVVDQKCKQVEHMDTMSCPSSPSSQVLHDMLCEQNRSHISVFDKVHTSTDPPYRHYIREEAEHDARTVNFTNVRRKQLKNSVEQNHSFRYIAEDQFPSDIQEQLKSINFDEEML